MDNHTNIIRIKAVHEALGELQDKVVFVGGATVSLYADRPAFEVRPTDDVDILIELYTRAEYIALEDLLRNKGFQNDNTAKFVGRYIIDGITVDVMPTLESILGFTNQWYIDGYANAIDHRIDDQHTVRIFTAPYFIAAKLEAFKSRGKNMEGEPEGRYSQDLEDIIFVLENRTSVWEELNETAGALKEYLKKEWNLLLAIPYIEEWVGAHVSYGSPPMDQIILDELKKFVAT